MTTSEIITIVVLGAVLLISLYLFSSFLTGLQRVLTIKEVKPKLKSFNIIKHELILGYYQNLPIYKYIYSDLDEKFEYVSLAVESSVGFPVAEPDKIHVKYNQHFLYKQLNEVSGSIVT